MKALTGLIIYCSLIFVDGCANVGNATTQPGPVPPQQVIELYQPIVKNDSRAILYALEKGVDPNSVFKGNKYPGGMSLLYVASTMGSVDVVKVLIDKGARPNQHDLEVAISNNKYEVVKLILGAGIDPNYMDQYGLSPLMRAAMAGKPKMVKLLLVHGADIDVENKDGETALDMARKRMNEYAKTISVFESRP